MFQSIKLRALITVAVMLAAIYYFIPSIYPDMPAQMANLFPKNKIRLGLDLQGGMHLLLEVDTEKAMESSVDRLANSMKESLMEKKVRFRNIESKGGIISIEIASRENRADFDKVLADQFPDLEIKSYDTVDGRDKLNLTLKPKRLADMKKTTLEQSLETIRNRIDQFGVTEPEIIPEGEDRILIQLPGIKDPRRAIDLIGRTALLEFKLVDEEHNLEDALRGNVPAGSILMKGAREGGGEKTSGRRDTMYLLKDRTLLTGQSLENAQVKISDRFGEPYVSIKFNPQGARDFDRITGENVNRRLAIVLDGAVYSAPVIKERISGGDAQITGSFTMDDAKDLAIVLRAGSLPAPVKILEQRTVGPSLGQDSIEKGILSSLIAFLLVIVFMLVYYKGSGVIANVALLLNCILTLGTLAVFQATLTLPGIAGILLVIGMAVDANVLIFERAREEIRLGKTPRAVIETGYGKAFITILDTHITTLIAAVFLFQFGTGPVKGFAVTLTIGLIYSILTAVFVTRIIFDYLVLNRKIKTLSI